MTSAGFPHSDIHGSTLASSSPWLFAGSRVLHRLLVPRHPPCALSTLTLRARRLPPDPKVQRNQRGQAPLNPRGVWFEVRGSFRHLALNIHSAFASQPAPTGLSRAATFLARRLLEL